ncbi:acyl transferasedomain-containing protein [Cordyceps javanica]|uniref:Acyl transferasedomain-containing protein n=1 Tax=Cordyceps javanica TaxID=43265 RepID=A0A545VET5_9HYPO|nr:acyl transferasedomain-containing protein [Cordyceps javanica]TQW11438.1 acyl transferase domain-containing protein [Cordyceps javanica]
MKNILRNYSSHLKENQDTSLSNLGLDTSFPEDLITKLDAASESPNDVGTRGSSVKRQPKILGVFTGQGAQWAGMGKELIKSCEFAVARLTALEMSLQQLPAEDRPSWSLVKTVFEAGDVMEAALSQPICTATQIILVDPYFLLYIIN